MDAIDNPKAYNIIHTSKIWETEYTAQGVSNEWCQMLTSHVFVYIVQKYVA